MSHSSRGDRVTGSVRAPGYTCSTSGSQFVRATERQTDDDRCVEEDRCLIVYLCQGRNQERPAEEKRPPGCRTAVGGDGSCEGAAP